MSKAGAFGTCEVCGSRKSKAAMVAHLKECLPSRPLARGVVSQVILLRVQARDIPIFWLDIAVKQQARLKDVDRFLRSIWLECCGHMSAFHAGAHRNVSMNAKLGGALGVVGERLGYVYDFGSSPELIVSLSGSADGSFRNAVQLAARNEPPIWPCDRCRQPATMVCAQCVHEDKGFCCADHATSHDCGEDMLLPVVNSPRMGVCGYTGED